MLPRSEKIVSQWIPMITRALAETKEGLHGWLHLTDAATAIGVLPQQVKSLVRRKVVKEGLAKDGFAMAYRGAHLYVYRLEGFEAIERSPTVSGQNITGEVKLVPGVLAEVQSKSDASKLHKVRLSKQGNIYCDCEGYAFRGHCAHIDTVVVQNPMVKVLVVASIRNRIAHLQENLAKLAE